MARPSISTYRGSDGSPLYYRHWRPAQRPRGRIVYLHGIQSHGGWFSQSCRHLSRGGYEVFFLDRRGSGLNRTDRGHADGWRQLVDDVVTFLRILRARRGVLRDRSSSSRVRGAAHEQWPVLRARAFLRGEESERSGPAGLTREPSSEQLPLILLSVSWGGKIAAAVPMVAEGLLDGLGLLYPGIGSRVRPSASQAALLRAACRLGLVRHRVRIPLGDPTLFTGSPYWQRYIAEDPLSLREATLGLLKASHDLDRMVPALPETIPVPTLMMLAGRDRLIDNDLCRRFFHRLATPEKTLIEYPGAQHTLEFEPEAETFLRDLSEWVDSIAAGKAARHGRDLAPRGGFSRSDEMPMLEEARRSDDGRAVSSP